MNVAEIAKAIDHALLQPTLLDRDFDQGCDVALRFGVAAVCVKSVDVLRAAKRVGGSSVAVCAVVGFPHGNAKLDVTRFEALSAIEDGATEIDAVVPLSRALSGEFSAVSDFVNGLNTAIVERGAILKMIFETGLVEDAVKVRLCEICKAARVAFVKTSTGFATAKGPNGGLVALGATEADVSLLVEHARPECQVKASGGIRTLDAARRFLELGATRIGTGSTSELLGSR
ncbi:MAG: deoxyribose-phosphate aldolase [Polyangiaceae bacterium]